MNSYWQLPARLFDDSEELADWARAALAAAQRAALRKRPKARKAAKPKVSTQGCEQAGCWPQAGGEAARSEGEEDAAPVIGAQATWLRVSAAYSGSTSQITRLRPLRLAA